MSFGGLDLGPAQEEEEDFGMLLQDKKPIDLKQEMIKISQQESDMKRAQ